MPRKSSLTLSSRTTNARLTPEQERFKYLVAQLERVRVARAAWDKAVGKFRTEHAQRLQPLRATLRELSHRTVTAIDQLLESGGWSGADRAALRQILCVTADALLAATPEDAELKDLFDKHSSTTFDAVKQEELERLKEEAEELTGLDLDDDAELRSEEDLIQRMYERMAEREAADDALRSAREQARSSSAADRRKEAAARVLQQSLREIYRKLASAVHPDRESDAQRRGEKTELMQRINRAYAANDLLTLLEVQMDLGQTDAEQLGAVGSDRLKQYNKLLAQQLEEARAQQRALEAAFREDFALEPHDRIEPEHLNRVTQRQARAIRAEITRQKEFLGLLANKSATRRWLKEQRRFSWDPDD